MIDVVIPLGNGSRWNDNELRYSLRSLVKFGSNFRHIVIVGEKLPEWIENVYWVKQLPTNYNHEHNIYENILAACEAPIITERFLGWQDDYFLTKPIDCNNYPFYYNGTLEDGIKRRIRFDGYAISLNNSKTILASRNCPTLNFDVHCPIEYTKTGFVAHVSTVDWKVGNGYVIKSLYANSVFPHGSPEIASMRDLKVTNCESIKTFEAQIADRHIFSISDRGLSEAMKNFLRKSYPEKSRYEK